MKKAFSSRRHALHLSSALASVLGCAALAPAIAQTLPSVNNPGTATVSPVVPGGTAMTVNLNNQSTVITWNTFSASAGTTVDFTTASNVLPLSVLNRVVTATPSMIDGAITSKSNIAVWLINGAGITFGPNGSFSGGSLVLSTLDLKNPALDDALFVAGVTPRTVAGTSTSQILLDLGSGITSSGSVLAIGQRLTANGTITAANGTVALIAATDVTLPANLGSPLSFTINAGTTLATAQASVGGAVSGGSVKLVGASEGLAIANLLNVDSGASLTATGNNGVVLIGTQTGGGVTFASAAALDGITSAGTLTTTGAAGDVIVTSTGAASQSGSVSAVRDYSLTSTMGNASQGIGAVNAGRDFTISAASGSAAVAGAVTAGRNYTVTAQDIALGGVAIVEQKAAGAVDMTATAGGITGTAGLTLTSNSDGLGTESLVLDATGGAISFNAGSTLQGGADRESTIGIRIGAAPQALTLGNVRAAKLTSVQADHTTFETGLMLGANAAPVVLGNVNSVNALNITANGAITTGTIDVTGAGEGVRLETTAATTDLTTGSINSDSAITLIATRDVILPSATTTNGLINVLANRDIGGPGGTGAAFTANGAGSDLTLTATTGKAQLAAIKAARSTFVTAATTITATTGEATAGDLVYDLSGGGLVTIGNQSAGRSIVIRAGGTGGVASQPGGASLVAGEDIAILTGSGGVALTGLQAGDDIDVVSDGAISLTSFDAQNSGANVDARNVDLSGAAIAFVGGETAGHVGANARLSNRAGAGDLTIGTSGAAARDIVLDTAGLADIKLQTAGGSIVVRGANVSGTTLVAGEDIAVSSGNVLSIGRADAGDDVILNASGLLTLGRASATGAGLDTRQVDLSGANIVFTSGEGVGTTGANISAISTGGDVIAGGGGSLTANNTALLRSDTGNVRVSSLSATFGAATATAALDVTGLAGASIGTSDTAFGRGDVSGNSVAVTAGGLAQLGTVTATNQLSVTAGSAAPARNGAVDITTATSTNGALTLIARAVAPVGTVYDGDILLGTGSAGTTATLSNTATGGSAGNIAIANSLTAAGNVGLTSANDIKIKEFVSTSPTTGFIRSTGGNVAVTAARSIYGIAGAATMVADRGVAAVNVGGVLTLNSTGDARFSSLTAGSINATVAGSLTGLNAGSLGTAVTGGALFANAVGGTVTVNAGGGLADVARLNTIQAGGDVTINAGNIAVGTLSSGGTVTLNGSVAITPGNLYIGSLTLPGNLSITLGGAPALINDVSTTNIFDALFGQIDLTTTGAITGTIGRVAQLGTVQSGTDTTLTAAAIGANTVTAGGALGLTATAGTLALGSGSGATATLTKQGGAIGTPGDDLRVTTQLVSTAGDTTILSNTHARVADARATGGDLRVTATLGDVNGGALSTDRANLAALSANGRVVVSAVAGNAQLGTVSAGSGVGGAVVDEVRVDARTIDVATANALNGGLTLIATAGDVRLGSGTAANGATVTASQSARIGSLTAQTGNVSVTATAGDVTGTALVAAPALAGLVTTSGTLTTDAGAANIVATVGAVTIQAGNAAQLGTITAGGNITANAKALVANTVTAGGALGLTATTGTLALGSGSGATATLTKQGGAIGTPGDDLRVTTQLVSTAGDTTILSNTHARVADARATGGDLRVTATLGDVNGGALSTDRANLAALSANGRVVVSAVAGNAQLGTVSAGSGVGGAVVDEVRVDARTIDVATANALNGGLTLIATAGDVRLGSGTAANGATVTASQSARIGSLTAQTGNVSVTATAGDVTGTALVAAPALAGLVTTSGTLTTDAGAANIVATVGAVTIQAGNAAQLGTITAGGNITANAKALVANTVTAGGALGLTATTGTLALGSGSGATATLTKQGGAIGTPGDDLRVTTQLVSTAGDTTILSNTHARVADARATGGDLRVTATLGDVNGGALSTDRANLAALSANGRVVVSAVAGNAQLGTVSAGSGVGGAVVDEVRVDARTIDVATANALNGGLTLIATAGDVRLGSGTAANGATVTASQSARIGSLTAQTGNVSVTATAGDVTGTALVAAPALAGLVTTSGTLTTDAGAANIVATVGAVNIQAGNAAQLGTITAGGNITANAKALVANTVTAGGALGLTATTGTLALGSGSGATATLTKQGGAIGTPGDDLRVTTQLVSTAGDTTILSNTHARVADARATGGDLRVTATLGDVNGGALSTDRANLAALSANGRVVVSAVAGNAQLGTVSAGSGVGGAVVDEVRVDARTIDVATANALNGGLTLIATAGDVRLGSGTAANGATVTASQSARIGSLTAQTGNASVTATAGDVTGTALVAAPALAGLVTTSGTLTTDAGAANIVATVGAVTIQAGNAAQLGTITAGGNITANAKALVANTVTAGGALGLTATTGTLALGSGSGATATLTKQGGAIGTPGDDLRVTTQLVSTAGDTTILSNTHARVADARATGGDLRVTATLGDVNGGALSTDRANLAALSANGRVVVSAVAGNAQLGTVSAGSGVGGAVVDEVRVDARTIDVATANALNGGLTLIATAGDVRLGSGTAANGATVTASQSARIGSLTAQTGNVSVTATAGDVTGTALVAAPALAGLVTTSGTLTTDAGAANIVATVGAVTIQAGNAAQLGTITAGGNITANAKALVANTVTAGGALGLTATAGTLALGSGSAGASATLTKQGGAIGTAGDELRVTGSLTAGAVDGQTGAATLTSSTHIRVPAVEARGGSISLTAIDGEVTGVAGGRASLTSALARNGAGVGIAGSDRSITVTSGLVSRLGTLTAGDNITVAAGSVSGAARDGSIDVIEATTTRGNLTFDVFNDNAATTGGITLTRTMATGRNVAGTATLRTKGSNGGAIVVSDTISAGGDIIADSVGDANMLHAIAGRSVAVRAGGGVAAADYSAGQDISILVSGAAAITTLTAGDDIDLTANSIAITDASASGSGPDTSAVDFSLAGFIAPTERADRGNANITLTSTAGSIAVSGDLSAQRHVTVASAGAATLSGNVTAGAPLGGTVIAGNYTVTGSAVTLGDAAARTQQASGAVSVTATGAIAQGAGRLTLTANSDRIGTEGMTLTAGNVALANSALVGGSSVGRESEVRVTANNGLVTLGKIDAQALNVRATTGIVVGEAIDAGNATRAADPVAGGSTIDLLTTSGGISLTTATASGAGHDIALTAPGLIGAMALNAGRDVLASSSAGSVVVPTITAGRDIMISAALDARLTTATASRDLKITAGNDSIISTGTATRDIAIDAGRHSRAATLGAGGAASVIARNGDATGLTGASTGTSDVTFGRGAITAGTTVTVTATGLVQLGAARAGTGLTVTAGDATRNGAIDVSSATTTAGNLLLDARAGSAADSVRDGDILVGDASAGGNLTLTNVARGGTVGDIVVATSMSAGGAALVDGARDVTVLLGTATGAGTVRAGRNATATSLTTGGTATLTAGSAATSTLIRSTGADVLVDGGSVALGTADAKTALAATARTGDLTLGTGIAGTTASLTTIANAGDIFVVTDLTSGQAATITSVGDARLANVKATTGALKVTALSGEVTGVGAGAANLEATAGSVQVDGGTLVRLGTVKSGTTLAVTGDTISTGALASGGASSLISDVGALTIASATSGGDMTLSTPTLATLGAITATGRKVTLTAADAAVNGVIAAQRIDILNKSASNVLRLGDGATGSGGFELTTAEINRLNAAEILLDAGTASGATAQDIAIGSLALDSDSGSSKLDIFGTKRIDLTGAFTASGSAVTRTIRFGGSAVDSARAAVIRVAATDAGGGRIDVGDAALELRGAKIGFGQDAGFLQSIGLTAGGTPLDVNAVANQYVGNANSSLYNASLGGQSYVPVGGVGPSFLTARSLTVRFTDYALFQNTSSPGRSAGVVLGGTIANPVTPALRLIGPNPPDGGAAALFGSINGTVETGSALLGPLVIDLVAINRANARINGCVVGASGGGCLVNLVSQPILGVFDSSKVDVFKTATDFELPFDPVVGTNNESLFGDVGTFGLGDIPLEAAPCPPDDKTCTPAKRDSQ